MLKTRPFHFDTIKFRFNALSRKLRIENGELRIKVFPPEII